jgi:hypothetical protein
MHLKEHFYHDGHRPWRTVHIFADKQTIFAAIKRPILWLVARHFLHFQ